MIFAISIYKGDFAISSNYNLDYGMTDTYKLVSIRNRFVNLGICLEADNTRRERGSATYQHLPTEKGEKGLRCLNTVAYYQELVLNKTPSFYQQKCNEKLVINTVLNKLRLVTAKHLHKWVGKCFAWKELEELCKNRESSDEALDDAEKDWEEEVRVDGEIEDRFIIEKRKQIGTICDDDAEACCPALVDNLIDYLELDKVS